MTVPTVPSMWQLADVEALAFRGDGGGTVTSRLAFKTATLIALSAFDRRVHPSGQAVCLLAPRWLRLVSSTTGAVVLAGLIGAVWPPLGGALLVLTAVVLLPLAVRATVALPARRRLRRVGPPGRRRYVYVHSVASTRPGAGAELMTSLAGEADQKGWLLVLDAGNESLGAYYAKFGFARGGAVRMPDGTVQVRMWRQPQHGRGSRS
ncbi:MAG: hypothetical protein ACLQVK_04200 [Acidimicrobiales bacterium]